MSAPFYVVNIHVYSVCDLVHVLSLLWTLDITLYVVFCALQQAKSASS